MLAFIWSFMVFACVFWSCGVVCRPLGRLLLAMYNWVDSLMDRRRRRQRVTCANVHVWPVWLSKQEGRKGSKEYVLWSSCTTRALRSISFLWFYVWQWWKAHITPLKNKELPIRLATKAHLKLHYILWFNMYYICMNLHCYFYIFKLYLHPRQRYNFT